MFSRAQLRYFEKALDQVCQVHATGGLSGDLSLESLDLSWVTYLDQASFSNECRDHALFVLAVIADERMRQTQENCFVMTSKGYAWKLFRNSNGGDRFFEQMLQLYQSHHEARIFYWYGVRCGFQGRFSGHAEALQSWLRTQGIGEECLVEPCIIMESLANPWWHQLVNLCVCVCFFICGLGVYRYCLLCAAKEAL